MTAHSRKTSISNPSNIAEGRRRCRKKDFRHFLIIAFGSGAELETQIEIAKRLPFGQKLDFNKIDSLLEEVMKMLLQNGKKRYKRTKIDDKWTRVDVEGGHKCPNLSYRS